MDISVTGRSYPGWPGRAPSVGGGIRGAAAPSKFSEALQNLREQAVAEKQQTVPTGSSCPRLTEAQRKYLSATYDITRMTPEEYAALAKDLQDFGIFTQDEMYTLGFSDPMGLCRVTSDDCGVWISPSKLPSDFAFSDGNLPEWVNSKTLARRVNRETGELYRDKQYYLYTRLYSILQQID